MWKLSQDLADKGGMGDVKDVLAAPRLVVLSGDVAASQRVYGVARSLARSSKMKATADSVRYMVLEDAHMAVEQVGSVDVLDMFQQSDFPSVEKRQTLLLSEARELDVETTACALLKPECAEVYEDSYSSHDGRVTSR
ncbi:hypothetical protein AAVH_05775 [Aphelenchoides avenae]|nr:hypothetical protein AAVH_05775 [Aphelenchus avenae]